LKTVGGADVVFPRKPMCVKGLTRPGAGVKQSGAGLATVGIAQVEKDPVYSYHCIGAELIAELYIAGIAVLLPNRSNHRDIGISQTAERGPPWVFRILAEEVGRLHKCVTQLKRDMRAQPVLHGGRRIVIGLIQRRRLLIKRESGRVGKSPAQP